MPLSFFAREILDWMDAQTEDNFEEYNRRRRLVLKFIDDHGLKKLSDADAKQQQEMREWIAGNP